jgi:transposase InsO family protein
MEKRSRGLRELCRLLGYTPQAYYQYDRGFSKREMGEDLLIEQVLMHRRLQPRLGTRKLLVMLNPFMQEHGIHIGRDRFFELLRHGGLLVRKKRKRVRTTFSMHRFRTYADLTKGLVVSASGQLWVSDITYVRLKEGFAYLSLITDAYSRKIIGFFVSHDLSTDNTLRALQMAIKNNALVKGQLIHHSDRGVQYCSRSYTTLLKKNGIAISMTQDGNPRDNAIAERVNGILKQELLHKAYQSVGDLRLAVKVAVDIYNQLRPHTSIEMMTPDQAHLKTGNLERKWQNYYRRQHRKEPIMDG